ncbi:MAG: glycosyltransferase family 4 protein [Anaerolineae bacterium]|nr:glycosyltransferase family 4 protein [Anaerolineae bacterium]
MRILYLAQLVPFPADAGPKVRMYHVLQYLAHAGHDVTLVAFHRPNDAPEAIAHLRQYCTAIHTVLMPRSRYRDATFFVSSLFKRTPFLIERDRVAAMDDLVRDVVSSTPFDAIHADQLWMAQYALTAYYAAPAPKPRLVLDKHNAVFLIPERLASADASAAKKAVFRLEARKMARYELETCAQFDELVWVTDEDRAALARIDMDGKLPPGRTIPICVNSAEKPLITLQPDAHRVMFLGGLHWPPNAQGILWFVETVWPLVRAKVPDAVLTIIGRDPPAELQHANLTNIEIPGYVTDLQPYLSESAVFTVPLHAGGGMRVKIIDAWSWGVPIVSTSIGAEGIQIETGVNVLIADEPVAFAQAVIRLLESRALREALRHAGRQTLESQYDWRQIYHEWDHIYPRPST